jgi:hypothetical protein
MEQILERIQDNIDVMEFYTGLLDWDGKSNVACPFPENHKAGKDSLPSLKLFTDTGGAFCHGCGYKATSPVYFMSDYKGISREAAARILYSEWVEPVIPPEEYKEPFKKLLENTFVMRKLEESRGITEDTVRKYRLGYVKGRLTIPIFNDLGMCVNIRRYDLFKAGGPKTLSFAEGYGKARLFPLETLKSATIFVVEGEMDCLLGNQHGIACVTPSGGAQTWKSEWNKKFKGKNVVIVPDNDPPGIKGAQNRMAEISKFAASCRIVELPRLKEEGEDLTDWLMKYGGSAEELFKLSKALQESKDEAKAKNHSALIAGMPVLPHEATARSTTEEGLVARAEAVWGVLADNGSFFKNEAGEYYYAQESFGVMRVTKDPGPFVHFLGQINPLYNNATQVGRFVMERVKTNAAVASSMSKTGYWSMYHKGTLYVHAGKDKLLKVTEQSCTHIRNAVNADKVLLNLPVPDMEVPSMPSKPASDGLQLLRTLFMDNLAMCEEDRFLFVCWLSGVFFRDYVKPKPIVRLLAKTAFGKSTASKLASLLIYGQEMLNIAASTMAAYYEMSAMYPVVLMDNLETRNMTPMLEDFLLIAATGGVKSKRLISADTGMVQYHANCLVLTNGIEPFNKHELIDRTMELQMDIAQYGNSKFHETKIFGALIANRTKILSALLYLIHKYVLPRVRKGEVGRIMGEFGQHGKERFNEYFALMALMLDALWGYLPIKGYKSSRDLTAHWLESQTAAVHRQNEGTDEVLYFLETYVARYNQLVLMGAQTRVELKDGQQMLRFSTRELLSDFRILARSLAIRCPWMNDRQLGTRLVDSAEVLHKAGWRHVDFVSSGRKKHKYWREADGKKSA